MDAKTIKQLLKIAEANLKTARTEFTRINTTLHDDSKYEFENLLEEAGNETYACEQVVRFLKEHLYGNKPAK